MPSFAPLPDALQPWFVSVRRDRIRREMTKQAPTLSLSRLKLKALWYGYILEPTTANKPLT
jgi:hypothetical protein